MSFAFTFSGSPRFHFWLLPLAILCFPIALTLFFLLRTRRSPDANEAVAWFRFRLLNPLITALTLAAWWAAWDSRSSEFLRMPHGGQWTFWVPPLATIWAYLLVCYSVNRRLLKLRWSFGHLIRLAWWKTASFSLPILMIAAGADSILRKETIYGILWTLAAGATNVIATGFLRFAEGWKLHTAKSGELRNRALTLGRKMGVTFSRFYIIPEGKGHLTNACGGSSDVAVTDNLGKFLAKRQIDFVFAHELVHVKHKHGLKHRLWAIAVFFALVALLILFRSLFSSFRNVSAFAIVLMPLLILYSISRQFEYAADREACEATANAENAIRALASLSASSGVPADWDGFTELFQTHPSLHKRVRAIVTARGVPSERVHEILGEVPCR